MVRRRSPTNLAIHRVAIGAELGDYQHASTLGERIDVSRWSREWIESSRGFEVRQVHEVLPARPARRVVHAATGHDGPEFRLSRSGGRLRRPGRRLSRCAARRAAASTTSWLRGVAAGDPTASA